MQDIYNYIPETNHASMVYSVAAILYLQFVLHVKLFYPWNMFIYFYINTYYYYYYYYWMSVVIKPFILSIWTL